MKVFDKKLSTNMAYKIIITRAAKQDFWLSLSYYTESIQGVQTARHFAEEFDKIIDVLLNNPLAYPLIDDELLEAKNLRKAFFMSHVVIYTFANDSVYILRVLHQRHDYLKLL